MPPAAPTISATRGSAGRWRSRQRVVGVPVGGGLRSVRSSRRRSARVPLGPAARAPAPPPARVPDAAGAGAVQPEPDALAGGQVGRCPSGWRSGRPAAGRGRARRPRRCRSVSLRGPTVSSSTGPGAKSETVTVRPIRRRTTSMSSSVRACSTALVDSSVVSSSASLTSVVEPCLVEHRADQRARAAGVRRSSGSRTATARVAAARRRPASADTPASSRVGAGLHEAVCSRLYPSPATQQDRKPPRRSGHSE